MIIGLFGLSSTGKTSIARRVMIETNCALRSCGEIVKSRAEFVGVHPNELSDEEHRQIDEDTRKWAIASDPCLVEGRYLDRVLAPIGPRVTLVRLVTTYADRRARRMQRDSRLLTLTEDELDLA